MLQVNHQALSKKNNPLLTSIFLRKGGPMDHGMPGMVNEFGMTPDASFLNQPSGPPITGGSNPSERGGSPEFMSTAGNFSESSNINEGLVW